MLAERDGPRVTLVESDSRKTAFLREVARRTGVPVDILTARIENPELSVKWVKSMWSRRVLLPR